jgi:hypothetical protein
MGGVNTFFAPLHRVLGRTSNPGNKGFPLNAAPSLDFLGSGIQDHRVPYNARGSSPTLPGILGWYGASLPMVINEVPSTAAVNNIAAAANPASGTPMTLVTSTAAGITVLSASAPALFYANPGTIAAGVAIDGLPSYHLFGAGGNFTSGFYNRGTIIGRCVSVSGVASGSGGTVLISGLDCYGFPMSQLVTVAAGANTVNTTKAFKVVTSVVPNFSDTHTLSVGTADIFGFGILASFFGDVQLVWNNAAITANTGFTAADTTSPATTTTGDVRGTYAVQSASDGTKRLQAYVTPNVGSMVTNPTTGLFGQPQV